MRPERDPHGMLIHGDAHVVLPELATIPALHRSAKLVYLDPPFSPADAFPGLGSRADSAWMRMVETCVSSLPRLLSGSGAVWFHIDPRRAAVCRAVLDEWLGRKRRWLTVMWERDPHADFGTRSPWDSGPHNVLLAYTADERGPHRVEHWATVKTGSMADATVELSGITGVTAPFPHAKPRSLIRHIVGRSTDAGDLVLDPFVGSGTVGEVSLALGRKWIGVERDGGTLTNVALPRTAQLEIEIQMLQ